MTKETKSILKKDLKKYQDLASYSSEENSKIYLKVANSIENILDKN